MSDFSAPYPRVKGHSVSGALAGLPPPVTSTSDNSNNVIAAGPFTATLTTSDPNTLANAVTIPYPTGSPTPLKYCQIVNFGGNYLHVFQGGFLGVVQPGVKETLKLRSTSLPLQVTAFQTLGNGVQGLSIPLFEVIWSAEPLSDAPSPNSLSYSFVVNNGVSTLPTGINVAGGGSFNTSNSATINGTYGLLNLGGDAYLTDLWVDLVGPGSVIVYQVLGGAGTTFLARQTPGSVQRAFPYGMHLVGANGQLQFTLSGAGAGTSVIAGASYIF